MKNIFFIVVLVALFSCKKENNPSAPTNQSNSMAALSYTLDAQGNPSGMYSGVFGMDSICISNTYPNTYNWGTGMYCFFYTTPQSYISISNYKGTLTPVNSVLLNGDKLGGSDFYQDTTGISIYPPYKWAVNGKGPIPSFTYTSTTPKPFYNGFSQLPNVINSQQNLTISLSGASGFDVFSVGMSDTISNTNNIYFSCLNN